MIRFSFRRDPQEIKEKDKKALMSGGLTFKLKLLNQHTFPMSQGVPRLHEEVVKSMTDLRSCPCSVHVLVKPNLAYIADDRTCGVMHIHLMSTITDVFMSREDPRFFMYCVNDFEKGKTTCFYFYTPKWQKKVTGERLFNNFLYAHHYWLKMQQTMHLRMLKQTVKSTITKPNKFQLPAHSKESDGVATDASFDGEVFALSEPPFSGKTKWYSVYFNKQGRAAARFVKF